MVCKAKRKKCEDRMSVLECKHRDESDFVNLFIPMSDQPINCLFLKPRLLHVENAHIPAHAPCRQPAPAYPRVIRGR